MTNTIKRYLFTLIARNPRTGSTIVVAVSGSYLPQI